MHATAPIRSRSLFRLALGVGAVLLGSCGQEPDVNGIANVVGTVWKNDSTVMASGRVIVWCASALVRDTITTDGSGHYQVSLVTNFSFANTPCTAYSPSIEAPLSTGRALIQFLPSNEEHPIQIIDLVPGGPT